MPDLKVIYASPPQVPSAEYVCALPEGVRPSAALLSAIAGYHGAVRRRLRPDEVHRLVLSQTIVAPRQ